MCVYIYVYDTKLCIQLYLYATYVCIYPSASQHPATVPLNSDETLL